MLDTTDFFGGVSTKRTKAKSKLAVPFVDHATLKFYVVASRGFYAEMHKLPESVGLVEAGPLFYGKPGEQIVVMPKRSLRKPPTPKQLDDPDDDFYRRLTFTKHNWAERVFAGKPKRLAHFRSPLTPAERHRYYDPLLMLVIPHVVGRFYDERHWSPRRAHRYVELYRFATPDVKAVDCAAPRGAKGPYELVEGSKGNLSFVAYWRSMSKAQVAEFKANMVFVEGEFEE